MMASCEKCWSDAHRGDQFSVADEYLRLVKEREENPCTPEQQAGDEAEQCPSCDRATVQPVYVKVCMACGWRTAPFPGHSKEG